MKILNVVGARPNFMKVAPLHRAFLKHPNIDSKVIHTGQHYDERMSDVFFKQLQLPQPDYYLNVGSGSHAVVTAKVMIEFEKIIQKEQPDLVLVVGDVNSTLACALVTKKLNIKLVHVEAGLRSGDRQMPEELNRILTDSISDYLFVTEHSGMVNLAKEGVPSDKMFFVGNVMIDSLCNYKTEAMELPLMKDLNLSSKSYVLMTMHRPSNVDQVDKLKIVINLLKRVCQIRKVVFPIHPRTIKNIRKFNLESELLAIPNLIILEPQGYLEFLNLMNNSAVIITDSGGIQEESTYLQIPCLTVRDTTERPITITLGSNILIPKLDANLVVDQLKRVLDKIEITSKIPPLWDGKTAERIASILSREFSMLPSITTKTKRVIDV